MARLEGLQGLKNMVNMTLKEVKMSKTATRMISNSMRTLTILILAMFTDL